MHNSFDIQMQNAQSETSADYIKQITEQNAKVYALERDTEKLQRDLKDAEARVENSNDLVRQTANQLKLKDDTHQQVVQTVVNDHDTKLKN